MPQGQPARDTGPPRARQRAPGAAGLLRGRLLEALAPLAESPLALVVAPPGWGKTTLMAQYAERFAGQVVWYRAEPSAARPTDVLDHLSRALAESGLGDRGRGGGERRGPGATTPESVLAEVEHAGSEVLLVVDDLHALEGAGTDAVLERLVLRGPANLHVLVGSRGMPRFNLSRLELGGAPIVDESALRFRWWEVDRLFTEVHREPLHPEDVLALARLADGWPAGLHLLHLGTRGRPLAERRRALRADGARFTRDYLEREVLDRLPAEPRRLLVQASVLDVLTAERCDALLGADGSRPVLDELARRGAVTRIGYDGTAYRCPPLLRQVLRALLAEEAGPDGLRARYGRAAELLAAEGAAAEALAAAAWAADWDTARRLLDDHGDRLVAPEPGSWTAALPPDMFTDHPALALEEASRSLKNGQLGAAADAYRAVEATLTADPADPTNPANPADPAGGREALLERCRRELRLATGWGPQPPETREHWSDWLRAAAWGDPGTVAADPGLPPGPPGLLVRGLALCVAGDYRASATALRRCRIEAEGDGVIATAAEVGQTVLAIAAGGEWATHVQSVAHNAELHDHPWLARLARAMLAFNRGTDDAGQARLVAAECDRIGDAWGAALATAVESIRQIRAREVDLATLADTEQRFTALGCGSLAAWARAARALAGATAGLQDAAAEAAAAERFARSAGVPAAQAISYCALAAATPSSRDDYVDLARATADLSGMSWDALAPLLTALGGAGIAQSAGSSTAPVTRPGPAAAGAGAGTGTVNLRPPPLVVRCFGGFEFTLADRTLDWSAVRPRARALLRLLAMQGGRAVHREDLLEALWPDLAPAAGTRNLQVAVSSLRTFLEPGLPRGSSRLVVRDGEAYLLAVPAGGVSDVVAFNEASRDGRRTRAVGRHEAAAEFLRAALAQYTGDLLPEDGPAEWVVAERERYRREAAEVAWALADVELSRGNPLPAAEAALRSLDIDPFRDSSWRTLIAAYEQAGDAAAAKRAQKGYADMLSSLGVTGAWRPGDPPGPARRVIRPAPAV